MLKGITNFTRRSRTNAIRHDYKYVRLCAFSLAAALLFGLGCAEDTAGEAGLEILPPEEKIDILTLDNANLVMETRIRDDVPTADLNVQLIGNYIDPEFGRISAVTYTQIVPGEGLESLGDRDRLELDSVVLQISLLNAYGRPESEQEIQVFEVSEQFPEEDSLNSGRSLAINNVNLVDPNDNDRFLQFAEGSSNLNGSFGLRRITLDREFGEKILLSTSEQLSNPSEFVKNIKGLAITTAPVSFLSREPGAIYRLFSNSRETDITLYYRRVSPFPRNPDTADVQTFLIDTSAVKYHEIKRTESADKILGITLRDNREDFHFLQSAGLIEIFCRFPDLDQIQALGVNRASLILKVDKSFLGSEIAEDGTKRFTPPPNIGAFFINADGEEEIPIIQGIQNPLTQITPSFNTEDNTYTFQFTTYVQEIFRGRRENLGFVIRPLEEVNTAEGGLPVRIGATNVNRVVIGGPTHPTLAPEFNLIYTSSTQ